MDQGKRTSRPVPLDEALAGAWRECGLAERFAERRMLDAWPAIVGRSIAAHSQAVDLHDGVLTLAADHGAWRQELTLLFPQIRERFNESFGADTVTEIRWQRPGTVRRTRDNRD